jgi:8-oxo-dGTP pyrophosphatase MutT (NUDIX family)
MDFNQQIRKRIVVAALIQKGDEYLFCWKPSSSSRNTHVDRWQMIGGGLEVGETREQGLIREVREETSLEISDIKFLSRKEVLIPNYKNTGLPCQIIYEEALARYNSGALELSEELEKTIWLKQRDFHLYPINPETIRFLNHIGLYPQLPNHTPKL